MRYLVYAQMSRGKIVSGSATSWRSGRA